MITVARYKGLNQSPALSLAVAGFMEAVTRGHGESVLGLHWQQDAVVAFSGEVPCGVIVYTYEEWKKELWLLQTYIHTAHRRKGIYPTMFAEIERIAREKGAMKISSGVHIDNARMRKVAEARGANAAYITYTQNVNYAEVP